MMNSLLCRRLSLAILFFVWSIRSSHVFAQEKVPLLSVEMQVDLGLDTGQNFGSLFEVYDAAGNTIAGAGFLGAYNTQPRSDRGRLHFFLKPKRYQSKVTALPRVNSQTGVYLSDLDDSLFAQTRSGQDPNFYEYLSESNSWVVDKSTHTHNINVAGHPLVFHSQKITYRQQTILDLTGSKDLIRENYYANGYLVLRLARSPQIQKTNRLVAIPWTPDAGAKLVDLAAGIRLPLRSDVEFVYAFGQLKSETVAATNTGGVYVFNGNTWKVLVEPDMKTSFQIYAMLNYYDQLLMGHYPTGELYSYDGKQISLLKEWPPVMPGVAGYSREAQSLAIYGGDLFTGVWPWGEVWRYDRNTKTWNFAQRMFSHPQTTDQVGHPYEAETKKVERIYNVWGQRVTSLLPFRNSLFISTSSKTGFLFDKKYDFLSTSLWKDYGKVYKLTLPGQLSAPIQWKEGPFSLKFVLSDTQMSIYHEGQLVGKRAVNADGILPGKPARIQWGRGVYGPLTGKIVSKQTNLKK